MQHSQFKWSTTLVIPRDGVGYRSHDGGWIDVNDDDEHNDGACCVGGMLSGMCTRLFGVVNAFPVESNVRLRDGICGIVVVVGTGTGIGT